MIETAIALALGHLAADFLLQTTWMVEHKRRPKALATHAAIVGLASWVCLGFAPAFAALALVTLSHAFIDVLKARLGGPGLTAFLTDQAAHGIVILAAARLSPQAFGTGLWGHSAVTEALPDLTEALPALMAVTAGLIAAVFAGGYAVKALMANIALNAPEERQDMPKGGLFIGRLERLLIFMLTLSGNVDAIGFLIAAKSVLRFNELTRERHHQVSEYVIVGTLGSFAWGLASAEAARWALSALGSP